MCAGHLPIEAVAAAARSLACNFHHHPPFQKVTFAMNLDQRSAGVLLHITSLPGPHGVGDLGPGAHHFVNWLVSAGQRIWQVLPTTPVGDANQSAELDLSRSRWPTDKHRRLLQA